MCHLHGLLQPWAGYGTDTILTGNHRVNQNIVTMTTSRTDLVNRAGPGVPRPGRRPRRGDRRGRLARVIAAAAARPGLPPRRHGRHGRPRLRLWRSAAWCAARSAAAPTCSGGTRSVPIWGEPTAEARDGLLDLTANFPAPVPAQVKLGELLPSGETAVEVLADLLRYPAVAGAARHRARRPRGLRARARARPPAPGPDQRRRGRAGGRCSGGRPARRRGAGRSALLQRAAQPRRPSGPAPRAGRHGRAGDRPRGASGEPLTPRARTPRP